MSSSSGSSIDAPDLREPEEEQPSSGQLPNLIQIETKVDRQAILLEQDASANDE